MKQKEAKQDSEVQDKYKVQVPIQLIFEYIGPEKDGEAMVKTVLESLNLISKFDLLQLGRPLFERMV